MKTILTRNQTLVLLFIIIGAIIRVYHLGFQYTNLEEDFTIKLVAQPLWKVLHTSLTADFTPPIYYIMAHFSMVVFGVGLVAARIPSAIFGTLLIPTMYLIGKEYKDEKYGLLLSGFTTIFYTLCFYSKYGRAYSVALFWFGITFYFFLRLLKGDRRAGIWFGIMAAVSIWTHLYTSIPLGVMILYLVWTRRIGWNIAPILVGTIALAYFYVPLVLNRVSGIGENIFGATPLEILFVPIDILGYSVVVILPIIIWSFWKNRKEKVIQAIGIISVVTWVSMFIISVRTPIILRYAVFLVPMLMVVFIQPFYEKGKVWWLAPLVVVLELYQIWLLCFVQRMV